MARIGHGASKTVLMIRPSLVETSSSSHFVDMYEPTGGVLPLLLHVSAVMLCVLACLEGIVSSDRRDDGCHHVWR
jgi:hypothetical protein